MKVWLKGGLCGLVVGVILFIVSLTFNYDLVSYFIFWIILLLAAIDQSSFIKNSFNCTGDGCPGIGTILILAFIIIEFFMVGAIISLIISKIKSK